MTGPTGAVPPSGGAAGPTRGLTTRGRCLLAGGVAAAVCAFLLDERDLLRVGVFAILLPLLAIAVTATRAPRLEATRQILPDRLTPGAAGQVTLSVVNTAGRRTRSLELVEPGVPGLSTGVRRLIPGLRPRTVHRLGYPVFGTRRGRFPLGPAQVVSHDVFGLWEEVSTVAGSGDLLVVPPTVPLTGLPPGAGNRSAASGRAAAGAVGGDPDVGVRAYRSGDDIRTIHWRASARHDELMVRLDEPVSHGGAIVLLDHRSQAHRGTGGDSSLELAISLTASIGLHLLGTDHEVLLTGQREVIAHGHDVADDVLTGLAELEPVDTTAIGVPAIGNAGMVVAVLGELSHDNLTALSAGLPRGVQGVALLLDTADWPGPAAAVPVTSARSALSAAGWRTVAVRRGDDLALAWRRACSSGEDFSARAAGPVPAAVR